MPSQIMQQVLEMIDSEVSSIPNPFEYELAYQVRVAVDRIRFAIKHTEQFCTKCEALREAGLELLDALQRLETVDRAFQRRSRKAIERMGTPLNRSAVVGNGDSKEQFS